MAAAAHRGGHGACCHCPPGDSQTGGGARRAGRPRRRRRGGRRGGVCAAAVAAAVAAAADPTATVAGAIDIAAAVWAKGRKLPTVPEAHRRRRQAARKVTAVACHPSQCRRTSPSGPQAAVGRRTPPPSVSLSSKRRDRVRGPSAKGSLFPSTGRGEAAAAATEGDVAVGWGALYGCRCVPSSSGREVERRNCTCRKWVLDRPRCAFADYSSPSVLNITSPRKKGKGRNRPLQLFHHGWFSQGVS